MRLRIFLAAVAAGFSAPVLADSLDINLNNDSVQAIYATDWRKAEFNAGFLSNSDQNDWVASMGLLASGEKQTSEMRTEAGLGGKVYVADVSNKDVLALGLGGQFSVHPNNVPVGFGGYLYYAPDVITFMDGKKFWEWGVRAEFEVVKKTANIYVGYRKVRADLDNNTNVTVDSGGHVGVKISF
ncbi:MAG: YfaZ family outer membrane protein [Pseudomonadota bacterium]